MTLNSEIAGLMQIKEMVTGEAKRKLFEAPDDAHGNLMDPSLQIQTKANITEVPLQSFWI